MPGTAGARGMSGLRAYSSGIAHCPKCQYNGIETAYHAEDAAGRCCGSSAEHLRRSCSDDGAGCGFAWAEACADTGAAPPGDGKRTAGGLPPYSGSSVRCPKCESPIVKTSYRAPDDADAGGPGEYLARHCCRCDYEWPEGCADAVAYPLRVVPGKDEIA